MAANTPLQSALNCTGMSNLEHIEVFQSDIPTVNLEGCSSLIRLCVEGGSFTTVDFSPVKNTLRDLRAGHSTAPQVDFYCDGPMTLLSHYCVTYQNVTTNVANAFLPAVVQYWLFGSGTETIDPPTSTVMNDASMDGCQLEQSVIDSFIVHCANNVPGTGNLRAGNASSTVTVYRCSQSNSGQSRVVTQSAELKGSRHRRLGGGVDAANTQPVGTRQPHPSRRRQCFSDRRCSDDTLRLRELHEDDHASWWTQRR